MNTSRLATARIAFDSIVCGGGLDQVTPTLSLKPGVARHAINFECGVQGGYTRIGGYERLDGHVGPSSPLTTGAIIAVASFVNLPVIGATLATAGGFSGYVTAVVGLNVWFAKVTGVIAVGNVLYLSGTPAHTIGTVSNTHAGPNTTAEAETYKQLVASAYRSSIQSVPGSGPVRGVIMHKDVVYALRDNTLATAKDIYKSSAAGWVNVPLYKTVSFTAGTTVPAEGATLTKGGVTATIKRVVLTSGAWTGTASGQIIITTPAGGNFSAGAATVGASTLTLSGAETSITLLPGGKCELIVANFTGATDTMRIYGCDGINKAFEFDGDVLVPITTGSTPDAPSHIVSHRGYLFVAVESSFLYSAPGLPYNWTGTAGAGEIAVGEDITGMVTMPGSTTNATLGVFSRNSTYILYGTEPIDFNFVAFNTGTGACAHSVQNMAQTLAFDDRGMISIQTALQYGNFTSSSLTSSILPFIREQGNKCSCATLCRSKSQYRIFFDNGKALYTTIVNGKLMGNMVVAFPAIVYCAFEGRMSNGADINLIGAADGFVYQLDVGPSFDGAPISWQLILNASSARSPRILKRYRKASVEMVTSDASEIAMDIGYALGYSSPWYSQPDAMSFSLYMSPVVWDSFTWDNFFWDSQGIAPLEVSLEGTAENIALSFAGASANVYPFTINSIVINYTPRRVMR